MSPEQRPDADIHLRVVDWIDKVKNSVSMLAIVAAVVTGLFSLNTTLRDVGKLVRVDPLPEETRNVPGPSPDSWATQLGELRKQIAELKGEALELAKKGPNVAIASQISVTRNEIKAVAGRLEKLEAAILASPAKALEIPLLQRDLENLKTSQQTTLASVKEGVDRIYDLNKYLLGSLALSILALALNTVFKSKDKATTQASS